MKIAIIDMDSVVFTIANPNKILDEQGNPKRTEDNSKFLYIEKTDEELLASMDFIMQDILLGGNFTHYIGFIKGKSTISDRKAVNTEYKANRPKESPKWWKFVKEALIAKWGIIEVNDMEVDDACRITAKNLPNSHIVAIDGDLLRLESFNPHYNWRKKEWITISKLDASRAFATDLIAGQQGDNIKGIPKKGEKYAKTIIEYCDKNHIEYLGAVLQEYIVHFGEYKGIQEFYKNYMCLYILEEKEGFILPEVIEFKNDSVGKEESIQNEA